MEASVFKIYTGILKASRSADGKMRLHGVASSTTKDLHGDVIRSSAIDDMERAANNNLTIFLNHSYNVPEDVGGSVEKAISRTRGVDQNGDPNVDLDFDILVNDSNPRAVSTFEAIERGTKLGLSIGAMIPDGGATRNKDGTLIIEHIELLETSLVGIPANPRSWVEYAVKALNGKVEKSSQTVPIGTPTLTLDGDAYTITGTLNGTTTTNSSVTWVDLGATCPKCGGSKSDPKGDCSSSYHSSSKDLNDQLHLDGDDMITESHGELPDSAFACISPGGKKVDGKTRPLSLRHYPHHTASGAVDDGLLRSALSRVADKNNEQCGKAHLQAHAKAEGMGEKEFEDFDLSEALDKDFHEDHFEKAKVTLIEIDTGDESSEGSDSASDDTPTSQDASTSQPGAEDSLLDETADGDDAQLGDDITRSVTVAASETSIVNSGDLQNLLNLVASTTRELVMARQAESEAILAKTIAERERDQADEERKIALTSTHQILTRLAEHPLVRKTAVANAQADLHARFGGVYNDDFLKVLERNPDA